MPKFDRRGLLGIPSPARNVDGGRNAFGAAGESGELLFEADDDAIAGGLATAMAPPEDDMLVEQAPEARRPRRRDSKALAEVLKKRAAECEEFQSAPKDSRASAVAEEKKDFCFWTKVEAAEHEAEQMAAAAMAAGRRKCTSNDELREKMERLRSRCQETVLN
mmetsp:Transcript_13889/g.37862  ORF Transcript_13889/g.37862 Transcript_13889/m.37862 type:complete len:163 (-) Transcript_13889:63-551(-)